MNKKDLNKILKSFTAPKKDLERADANADLLNLLTQYLADNPTQRFCQALRNLGIVRESIQVEDNNAVSYASVWVNEFYTESTDTLENVNAVLNKNNEDEP